MEEMAKAEVGTPGREELAAALGPAHVLWDRLLAELEKQFGPLTHEWKKYTKTSGWTLRLLLKKRALIYLSPAQPVLSTVLLGDKAVGHALADEQLPQGVAEEIRRSKRYPEGTGVRLEVRQPDDIAAPVRLIRAKLAG